MITKPYTILLSFDVEECKWFQNDDDKNHRNNVTLSATGTEKILTLLHKHQITATFFVTGYFATQHPDLIKKIALHHEVASHSMHHDTFNLSDIQQSKQTLESIINQPVYGIRMPGFRHITDHSIIDAGYTYTAGDNPSYRRGKKHTRHMSRTSYVHHGLVHIPISTTPLIRFPFARLVYKYLPVAVATRVSSLLGQYDKYLSIYSHPWEFTNLESYNVPHYMKYPCGETLLTKFDHSIGKLKQEAIFVQHQSRAHQTTKI